MKRNLTGGFTLIQALIVVAISLAMTAVAVPVFTNAVNSYRFSAAVSAATGAISATRFQAIMNGYPYEIVFTASTMSYRVYSETTASCPPAFTAVGSSIPMESTGGITMTGPTVTYTFYSNGTVYGPISTTSPCPNTAAPIFEISNSVKSNYVYVSGVGDVETCQSTGSCTCSATTPTFCN